MTVVHVKTSMNVYSMSVVKTQHVKILLVLMNVLVIVDILVTALNVMTSMNVIMVSIHVLKMFHVRTLLVHTRANVRMDIVVKDLNVPISMSVQCHHVMRKPLAEILLVALAVNVMMVLTVMGLLV